MSPELQARVDSVLEKIGDAACAAHDLFKRLDGALERWEQAQTRKSA